MTFLGPDETCPRCNATPGYHSISCTDDPYNRRQMPTKQQKDPMLEHPTKREIQNFFNNMVPGWQVDLLGSDAFRDKVIEIVTAHANERMGVRESGLVLLPETDL